MAHYDIYEDLGLDRSLESGKTTKILDERLAATPSGNVADLDRLKTARKLFEDDTRRVAYDKALADPTSPEITIGRFRAFADGTFSDTTARKPQSTTSVSRHEATTSGVTTSNSSASHRASTPTNMSWAESDVHGPVSQQSPSHSVGYSGYSPTAAHAPSSQSTSGAPNPTGFDLRSLAVSPNRKRTESLMWLIGWMLILLGWLVLLGYLVFDRGGSSEGLFASIERASVLGFLVSFVIFHTAGMLVTLNSIWHLRVYYGRKIGL